MSISVYVCSGEKNASLLSFGRLEQTLQQPQANGELSAGYLVQAITPLRQARLSLPPGGMVDQLNRSAFCLTTTCKVAMNEKKARAKL